MKTSFSMRDGGSTLIELLAGMAIFLVLAAAGLRFVGLQARWSAHQDRIREAQMQVQTAFDMVQREISLAGTGLPEDLPALTRADPREISFWANPDRERTMLTAAVYPNETVVSVDGGTFRQGRDFEAGDVVWICGGFFCERNVLARDGGTDGLQFVEGVRNPYPGGSSVEVVHHIRYGVKAVSPGRFKLIRAVDGGAGPLAENLKNLGFRYRDWRGNETGDPARINRVGIELEVAVSGRPDVERILTGESWIRNR